MPSLVDAAATNTMSTMITSSPQIEKDQHVRQTLDPPAKDATLLDALSRWLGEHPEIAVGAAVSLGVVLGWLIKRK